jgi:hypothetical protein
MPMNRTAEAMVGKDEYRMIGELLERSTISTRCEPPAGPLKRPSYSTR